MTDDDHLTIADLERGLRFGHLLMSVNRHMSREGAAYSQSLVSLLMQKGIITPEEFEEQVNAHRKAMKEDPQVMLSKAPDKYNEEKEVLIDCAARLHLCRAACCSFRFYLSSQDLDEGIVKWDYGNPYWVRQRDGGYCHHCRPGDLSCDVHQYRPYTCRIYDCRQDKRIWVDFEKSIPNPELAAGE
jgi:Fe-S-cluster containining protein